MNFTKLQKTYLINLVKHDLETLEQLAGDDQATWGKDLETARAVQIILCGGCNGDCDNCQACGGEK